MVSAHFKYSYKVLELTLPAYSKGTTPSAAKLFQNNPPWHRSAHQRWSTWIPLQADGYLMVRLLHILDILVGKYVDIAARA